ncbi:MAG: ACT domain-containing protein [Sedimentisphaerales bacterium]|nr:ACT domain-containing protein [Sedimentisphaerales bacterium]
MTQRKLKLSLLEDKYAICSLPNNTPIPGWALKELLASITRTDKELTIVCKQDIIPSEIQSGPNWRCFKIDGSFDLNQTGVISSISSPLSDAGISIYVISTYDTDYFLVKEDNLDKTIATLSNSGHNIKGEP